MVKLSLDKQTYWYHTNYDFGWNDRINEVQFNDEASRDWKDGWLDCDDAIKEGRPVETKKDWNTVE